MTYVYEKDASGNYVCPHCKVTKKNQNTMHYHMKKHEGHLPFVCPTCKKEFLHKQTLDLHNAARHSDKEEASFKCPCCPYKTLTKANRVIHFMRKHCEAEVAKFSTAGLTCPSCKKECNCQTAFLYHIAANCIQLPEAQQLALNTLLA